MPRQSRTPPSPVVAGSPFLTHVTLRHDRVQPVVYPFDIPLLSGGLVGRGCRSIMRRRGRGGRSVGASKR